MDKKDETSTNHFSVKLRTLLFTIWFDFMTLTQNFNITSQSVTKCHKVSQSFTNCHKVYLNTHLEMVVGGGGEWWWWWVETNFSV